VDLARPSVSIRFSAELNDHLPEYQRYQTLEKPLATPATAKDLIESFDVPHTEVDLILLNSVSAEFAQLVQPGDRLSVYPVFESFDITSELRLRPQPLRETKFVLDVHLGKLAAYLRMLGFDTRYQSCFTDSELAGVSAAENRILLTRDRGLLKRSMVTHGYWLRETDSRRQIAEILDRFDLSGAIHPFVRCMACSAMLEAVVKDQVRALVPPRAAELHDEFRRCPNCGRVYWKGSHYRRMESWIRELAPGDQRRAALL
jgi:uncharacterized protein with PIN domain